MIQDSIWPMLFIMAAAMLGGMRLGGIGLGVMGGMGVFCTSFILKLEPGNPPFEVLMLMMSVITAASILEAAGGLDYFTGMAARLIRRYPSHITWLSPMVSYLLVWTTGTSHIIYPFLSIVMRVSEEVGVPRSKPLITSVLASQQAIIASPVSAATAVLLTAFSPYGYGMMHILGVLVPATLAAMVGTTLAVHLLYKEKGVKLSEQLESRLEQGESKRKFLSDHPRAKKALSFFLCGLAFLLCVGNVPSARMVYRAGDGVEVMKMSRVVSMVMLSIGALIMVVCRVSTGSVLRSKVFKGGMQAVVGLLGIAWLGNTFLKHYMWVLQQWLGSSNGEGIWQWLAMLFIVTILSNSPGATLQMVIPLALQLGVLPTTLLAVLPAAESFYVIPSYPTIQAAIALDEGKTLKVGKMVLNHSFLLPGLIGTLIGCITSYAIVYGIGI